MDRAIARSEIHVRVAADESLCPAPIARRQMTPALRSMRAYGPRRRAIRDHVRVAADESVGAAPRARQINLAAQGVSITFLRCAACRRSPAVDTDLTNPPPALGECQNRMSAIRYH